MKGCKSESSTGINRESKQASAPRFKAPPTLLITLRLAPFPTQPTFNPALHPHLHRLHLNLPTHPFHPLPISQVSALPINPNHLCPRLFTILMLTNTISKDLQHWNEIFPLEILDRCYLLLRKVHSHSRINHIPTNNNINNARNHNSCNTVNLPSVHMIKVPSVPEEVISLVPDREWGVLSNLYIPHQARSLLLYRLDYHISLVWVCLLLEMFGWVHLREGQMDLIPQADL